MRQPADRTYADVLSIEAGLVALRTARAAFREAGARRAALYAQRAIKSAEGARNHADAQVRRAERERGA